MYKTQFNAIFALNSLKIDLKITKLLKSFDKFSIYKWILPVKVALHVFATIKKFNRQIVYNKITGLLKCKKSFIFFSYLDLNLNFYYIKPVFLVDKKTCKEVCLSCLACKQNIQVLEWSSHQEMISAHNKLRKYLFYGVDICLKKKNRIQAL